MKITCTFIFTILLSFGLFADNDTVKDDQQNTYYADGTLKSVTHYKNGEIHGRFLRYYPDGTLKEKGK